MTIPPDEQPLIALADDDAHSARLLVRTLQRYGTRRVRWTGNTRRSLSALANSLAGSVTNWPCLIIVDLKADSTATADFIRAAMPMLPASIPIVAMAPSLEREVREQLIEAGAAAVFERHAEHEAYQFEVANIMSFLDRYLLERCRHDLGRRRAQDRWSGESATLVDWDLAILEEDGANLSRTGTE